MKMPDVSTGRNMDGCLLCYFYIRYMVLIFVNSTCLCSLNCSLPKSIPLLYFDIETMKDFHGSQDS